MKIILEGNAREIVDLLQAVRPQQLAANQKLINGRLYERKPYTLEYVPVCEHTVSAENNSSQ